MRPFLGSSRPCSHWLACNAISMDSNVDTVRKFWFQKKCRTNKLSDALQILVLLLRAVQPLRWCQNHRRLQFLSHPQLGKSSLENTANRMIGVNKFPAIGFQSMTCPATKWSFVPLIGKSGQSSWDSSWLLHHCQKGSMKYQLWDYNQVWINSSYTHEKCDQAFNKRSKLNFSLFHCVKSYCLTLSIAFHSSDVLSFSFALTSSTFHEVPVEGSFSFTFLTSFEVSCGFQCCLLAQVLNARKSRCVMYCTRVDWELARKWHFEWRRCKRFWKWDFMVWW